MNLLLIFVFLGPIIKVVEHLPPLKQLSHQEKDALILKLWEENRQLRKEIQQLKVRLAKLEAKLNDPPKTSENSSVPPSKTPKPNLFSDQLEGELDQPRPGHHKGGKPLHPNPDHFLKAILDTCPKCGENVPESDQSLLAVYDKYTLPPIKPIVTRVNLYQGKCSTCHHVFVAPVPKGMEPGSPYDDSIISHATYFHFLHAISYERLDHLFQDIFHLPISEGAIANMFQDVKERFRPRAAEILERVRNSQWVGSDETGARVAGKNAYEWVFQNDEVCYHTIRPKRNQVVMNEVMGDHHPLFWVSDLYNVQKNNPAKFWQVCLSHQIRNCQYAVDAGDQIFAPQMLQLFARAFRIYHRHRALPFSEPELLQLRLDLKHQLEQCLRLEPLNPHGKRLKKRYQKLRENLFLFLEYPFIPPTNNASEQAIRMSVIFRKVTNGFRSWWGAEVFAFVRSIVNTGRRQGLNAYQAIQKALSPVESFFEGGGARCI